MRNKKGPPDTPAIGDRVTLRGKGEKGVLKNVNKSTNWSYVDWEESGPKICHLFELERINTIGT